MRQEVQQCPESLTLLGDRAALDTATVGRDLVVIYSSI